MATWQQFIQSVSLPVLLLAALTTVWISLAAQALATVIGIVMGFCRRSRFLPVRVIAAAYVHIFRGTAELLQIVAWYAVLPLIGIDLTIIQIGIFGLGINEGARMTEIVRAGLLSVDQGQADAAKSLGFGHVKAAWYITLPQAARVILPPTGNEMNTMFKTSSLVSVIGLTELLRQTELLVQTQAQPLGTYLAAAFYYLVLSTLWNFVQHGLERRVVHAKAPLRTV